MTDHDSAVRTESFPCSGPADIQVHLVNGEVLVELTDTDVVTVAIYPGVRESSGGIGEWLGRLDTSDTVAAAVSAVTTHFIRGRLVVATTRRRLSPVPLRIVVRARPGSKLQLSGSTARFAVSGAAGSLNAAWGSGDLSADTVEAACKLRAGSGKIRLGASNGQLNVRIGTSDLDVQRVAGNGARITTGSGILNFGTVEADLSLTTGADAVSVADAAGGRMSVRTGPGSIRVGVRAGIQARVDLTSRSGSARSELPVSDVAPTSAGSDWKLSPLRISAVTTSGDILVSRAA
jgi:hypothetical protein